MRTLRIALGLLVAAAPLAAQRRAMPATHAAATNAGGWQLAIGTAAGFVDVHPVGSSDITALMLPGWGSALVAFSLPFPTIPALYATIPIGDKMAIEPTLDIHRSQTNGPQTRFGSNIGARLDYGFNHAWYGAAGVNVLALKGTGTPTFAAVGVALAGGVRFHFSGAWSGRFELSHTMMAKHQTAGLPPVNVTALSFGTMVALR